MSTVTIVALYGLAIIWGLMIGFAPFLMVRGELDENVATDQRARFARWLWTRGLRPALGLSALLGAVIVIDQLAR